MKESMQKRDPKKRMDLLAWISQMDQTDVDGSYTGTDADGEEPVQDADDL